MCAADLSDILIGHSTWDTWSAMVKLHKHYDFRLRLPEAAAGRSMSFTSYPGTLCLPVPAAESACRLVPHPPGWLGRLDVPVPSCTPRRSSSASCVLRQLAAPRQQAAQRHLCPRPLPSSQLQDKPRTVPVRRRVPLPRRGALLGRRPVHDGRLAADGGVHHAAPAEPQHLRAGPHAAVPGTPDPQVSGCWPVPACLHCLLGWLFGQQHSSIKACMLTAWQCTAGQSREPGGLPCAGRDTGAGLSRMGVQCRSAGSG